MLDVIKLRFEAIDGELEKNLLGIRDHLIAMEKSAVANTKALKELTTRVNSDFQKVNSTLGQTKQASGSVFGDLLKANLLQNAVGYAVQLAKSGFDVATNFEKVKVTFENAFGDKDLAAAYLDQIQQFAAKTPFEFDKLAESILKLKNRGFQPTVEELTKLGDLAATTGKDFDQLAEAVLDAQTGEFERLKEFGIRATKANGEVTLSFKGQTKVVKENDEAIRNAIVSFGELNGVQGAMAVQSDTVAGQISNLKDNLSRFAIEAGSSLGGGLKDGLVAINEFLGSLDTQKIFAFFAPITEKLIPALELLYNSLKDYVFGITDANSASDIGKTILNGLQKALNLVVDAFVAIIDVSTAVYNKFTEFNDATGILTAVFDGLKNTISFLADAFDYIFQSISKLSVGEEEYNKRIIAAKNAEIERAKAAEDRKKKMDEAKLKLAEQQKQQEGATKATKDGTDADKAAKKAAEERVKALEELAKAITSFEDKISKANIGNLNGVDKIQAERKAAQDEIKVQIDAAKEKANIVLKSNAATKKERQAAQDELIRITELGGQLEVLIDDKYNAELIKQRQEDNAKQLEIAKSYLDEQIKLIDEEGKLQELKLEASQQGESIYTVEETIARKRIELQQKTLAEEKRIYLESLGFKNVDNGSDAAPLDTRSLSKDQLAKLEEYNAKEILLSKQLTEQKYNNNLAYINRLTEVKTLEIELITESGNESLSLEKFKEAEKQRIQIEALQSEIKIAQERYGENSPEVKLLALHLKIMQKQLEDFNANNGKDIVERGKSFIAKALGVTDDEFEAILSKSQELFNSIGSLIQQQNEIELEQLQQRQSVLDEKIKQTEDNIKKEQDLKDRGLHNNLAAEQENLAKLQAEKKKAAEEEKKIRKDQLTQQLVQDELRIASSLAVAIANIIQWETATKGFLGIITAGIGIIGAIALFSKYKSQVSKLEDGGSLLGVRNSGFVNRSFGRSDRFGGRGHRIEDSNVVVGGSEFIINEEDSLAFPTIIEHINKGSLRKRTKAELKEIEQIIKGAKSPIHAPIDVRPLYKIYRVMDDPSNKHLFNTKMNVQDIALHGIMNDMSKKVDMLTNELVNFKKEYSNRTQVIPFKGGHIEIKGKNKEIVRYDDK